MRLPVGCTHPKCENCPFPDCIVDGLIPLTAKEARKRKNPRISGRIEYEGQTYLNVRQACLALGVRYSTIYARLINHPEWDFKKAVEYKAEKMNERTTYSLYDFTLIAKRIAKDKGTAYETVVNDLVERIRKEMYVNSINNYGKSNG